MRQSDPAVFLGHRLHFGDPVVNVGSGRGQVQYDVSEIDPEINCFDKAALLGAGIWGCNACDGFCVRGRWDREKDNTQSKGCKLFHDLSSSISDA